MYSDLCETRKLKVRPTRWPINVEAIYHAASEVRNAIPHPRIMGVIKECGGKMWMTESACPSPGSIPLTFRIVGQSLYRSLRIIPAV